MFDVVISVISGEQYGKDCTEKEGLASLGISSTNQKLTTRRDNIVPLTTNLYVIFIFLNLVLKQQKQAKNEAILRPRRIAYSAQK
eukprot:Pgem_evm1s5659